MNKIIAILMLLLLFSATATAVPIDKEEFTLINIVVHQGDTIWDLGNSFATKDEDVRAVVDRIYKANGIEGNAIKPGQKLVIPVQKEYAKDLVFK